MLTYVGAGMQPSTGFQVEILTVKMQPMEIRKPLRVEWTRQKPTGTRECRLRRKLLSSWRGPKETRNRQVIA